MTLHEQFYKQWQIWNSAKTEYKRLCLCSERRTKRVNKTKEQRVMSQAAHKLSELDKQIQQQDTKP
uniref:hypothetical protein n=1 Tax=Shewanella sp. TaxID=50422 RepID=UPI004047AE4D